MLIRGIRVDTYALLSCKTLVKNIRNAGDALQKLSSKEPNIDPYLFSFWQTIRFRLRDDFKEAGLLVYLEKLSNADDDRGTLPAQASEALEDYYHERHELHMADTYHLEINAISDWMLIGPFENLSASGYDKVYPPETEFNAAATYEGKGGVPTAWFPIASPVPFSLGRFHQTFCGNSQSIFYANTFVYSPAKRSVVPPCRHVRIPFALF